MNINLFIYNFFSTALKPLVSTQAWSLTINGYYFFD